jgi:SNF2 family DNA or RNA helicase
VQRMVEQERLGLFLDPGLGKTAITLEAFRRLRETCEVSRMLVIAPLRPVYSVWPEEVARWDRFEGLRVQVIHGPTRTPEHLRDADIFVTNTETLEWLVKQKWRWPEMLVIDELTKFKHRHTYRERNLAPIKKQAARRYGLTGTPAPNGLQDLFGQLFALDDGVRLGRTLKAFRERFWFAQVPDGRGYFKWVETARTLPMIQEALRDIVIRLRASDHLDLPQLVTTDVQVPLSTTALDIYEELRRELIVRLETGDVVAANAGALTSKCRQVANGIVYLTDDGTVLEFDANGTAKRKARSIQMVHTKKLEALKELIDGFGGEPALVLYEFRSEIEAIQKTLGGYIPFIGGGVAGAEGAELLAKWNRGELPVLLVHPRSAAHGLNLQRGGSRIVWYSLPWDLELYDQANARLWRQGQTAERVMIYHLLAQKTIDRTVARALSGKARVQEQLLESLREDLA